MKTLLLFIFLTASAYSQDVDTLLSARLPVFQDTLTATIDTIQVRIPSSWSYYTITAYTSTGTDSVEVSTLSINNLIWSRHGVTDLSTGVDATQIVVTTTAIEFYVMDTTPNKIRLVRPSNDAGTTIIVVSGKK